MKATLLALLTLGSFALAADETPVTFTHATNNNQAGYNGFNFILDSKNSMVGKSS